ncbi:MAG: hypothetical protein R3C42_08420 [Parvularculaceae bacterium]|nr:hypothetical protein [Parvularculaceae bacterium]
MKENFLRGQLKKAVFAAALVAGALSVMSSDASERKRDYQLQLGLGFAAPFNMEEPFIDLTKTRGAGWRFGVGRQKRISATEALEAGYLDPASYMPTPKSRETSYAAVAVFMPNADRYREYYAGDYILDWKGEAYGFMQRWPKSFERRRTSNSVEYSMPAAGAKGGALRFSGVGEGFTGFRLYRKEYAARLAKGELWNPDFLNYVRRYDIIRTMDLQSTNNTAVRRYDQLAEMDEPWGQGSGPVWPEPPFYSIPYEALFNLGVTADVKMWMTLPPQLGSPIAAADPSLRRDNRKFRISGEKVRDSAAKNAAETLKSPEWEKFAKSFVDRYVASGYPLNRPLYLEVGNEIWNLAGGFYVSTRYAEGIGRGVNPEWAVGQGYGVLVARYMMALESEFARRKIRPNVTYVVASHTANPWRTKTALEGLAEYLKRNGVEPAPYLAMTGVAVTNYYGHFNEMSKAMFGVSKPAEYAPLWIAEMKKDPEAFARRLETLLAEGPQNVKANGAWVIARWREHKAFADRAGSRFIGAYEGGSHLLPPKELVRDKSFLAWWLAWHWSEGNAGVARRINRDIADAFPGVIISNYESIGTLGPDAPWNDGHYSQSTPMMDMWDEFAKTAPAK